MITLIDCIRDSYSISNGLPTSVYKARYLVEGFAFQAMNPALDRMYLSFYGLNKWAALANPRPGDQALQAQSGAPDQISILVDMPDQISAWRNGIKLGLEVKTNMKLERFERGSLDIQHRFSINPRRPQMPLKKYIPHITKLNNFVSLGMGHSVDPSEITAKIRTYGGPPENVEIFYQVRREPTKDISVHPSRMPFRPPEIADSFSRVLNYWYDRSEEIGDIYELYFATVHQDQMYVDNKILSLCHGLESYHRNRFSNTYMSKTDYDDLYDDIIDLLTRNPSDVYPQLSKSTDNLRDIHDIPSSFVQSLKDGTIKHANSKSLRKRLNEITEAVEPIIEDLPYSILGDEKLTADTRNYFSHRTKALEKKAAHGPDRTKLVWGLQQLIEACLLIEIGIKPDLIQKRLESRYENRWVSN